MLLDEWGGGHRVVQDQNEEVEISPTFQQLDEDNPEHRVGQDQGEKVEVSPTFQQLGDKERKSDVEKEKAKCKGDINELKKKNKKMKKEIEKLKKRKRPKESQESKEKRIKSSCTRNSEGCNEKWAAFSSAAIGPAAAIIKQVRKLFNFNQHTFPDQFYLRKRPDYSKEDIKEGRLLGGREHSQASSNSKPL